MVDMAHIAGLVAGGVHPNPMEYADVVTSTTHKTLRGARGGLILCGPLENQIAGKAQAFYEADTKEFKQYTKQVVENCQTLAKTLEDNGMRLIAGGTDNHLLIVETKKSYNLTGREAEKILEQMGIVTNKNMIPFDEEKPFYTSGIRMGTAAMTTRGFKENEFKELGLIICEGLKNHSPENLEKLSKKVKALCDKFPIYKKHYLLIHEI
ncbi:hypothetical protein FQA39_LY12971 [Lamprigera yunnana]|nr:hypothetical protein FQA39_LY12971 [Lamprigera yunnana]